MDFIPDAQTLLIVVQGVVDGKPKRTDGSKSLRRRTSAQINTALERNQSTNQSTNQPTNQSNNQSINQAINQSNKWSYDRFFALSIEISISLVPANQDWPASIAACVEGACPSAAYITTRNIIPHCSYKELIVGCVQFNIKIVKSNSVSWLWPLPGKHFPDKLHPLYFYPGLKKNCSRVRVGWILKVDHIDTKDKMNAHVPTRRRASSMTMAPNRTAGMLDKVPLNAPTCVWTQRILEFSGSDCLVPRTWNLLASLLRWRWTLPATKKETTYQTKTKCGYCARRPTFALLVRAVEKDLPIKEWPWRKIMTNDIVASNVPSDRSIDWSID